MLNDYCVVCTLYTVHKTYTNTQYTTRHYTKPTLSSKSNKHQQTVESFSTIRNSWPNFSTCCCQFDINSLFTESNWFCLLMFWISLEKIKSYIQFEWLNPELPIKPKSNTDWLKWNPTEAYAFHWIRLKRRQSLLLNGFEKFFNLKIFVEFFLRKIRKQIWIYASSNIQLNDS